SSPFHVPPTTQTFTLSLPELFRSAFLGLQPRPAALAGHPRARGDRDDVQLRLVEADAAIRSLRPPGFLLVEHRPCRDQRSRRGRDRKSTRLKSSHVKISYAVFCLK